MRLDILKYDCRRMQENVINQIKNECNETQKPIKKELNQLRKNLEILINYLEYNIKPTKKYPFLKTLKDDL